MIRTTARHLGALVLPALVLTGATGAWAQAAAMKIAVVDIQTVVADSKAGRELEARLESFRVAAQEELKAKNEALKALRQQLDATQDPAETARLTKQLEREAIDLQRLGDDKQRQGQKMQEDGLRAIEKSLAPIFRQLRDEQGYDLILARTPGVTLIVSDRVDLTQTVLERYNASQ